MRPLPRLMVAPNGARRAKSDHPALPVTIAETVATARACFDAGADGLHAHVRNAEGHHTLDAGLYRELLAEMARAVPDMAVQVTTEAVGRYTPAEQRALVGELRAEAVSVALREMAADDDIVGLHRFYHDAVERDMAIQHILYDADDAARLVRLVEQKTVPPGPMVLIVLGQYDVRAAMPSDLAAALGVLTPLGQLDWAVCAFGHHETACLLKARSAGGKMRAGFENNIHRADGTLAADNAERIAEIVRLGDLTR